MVTIGDNVEVFSKGKTTYSDSEKACGFVNYNYGKIIGFKSGWFRDYWIIQLNNGKIIKMRPDRIKG